MRIPLWPHRPVIVLTLATLVALAGAACGTGDDDELDLAPMIQASLVQSPPTQTDRVVFFNNVTVVGDIINLDVAVQDSTGTLDMDDADIVLRYDASFMQLVDIRPETLFGNCGSVNSACGLTSPVCIDNQSSANGGGENFCRSNGSAACLQDTDCTTTGDACGDFGRLQASFVVITGPKTCSNNPALSCTQQSDCHLCTADPSLPCSGTADCTGTCVASFCSGGAHHGDPCVVAADCLDFCNLSASCAGCPSKIVSGTEVIVNLRFRVIDTGRSELRFVTSGNSQEVASFLRKDTLDLAGVQFWPSVDAGNPASVLGTIVVEGTK